MESINRWGWTVDSESWRFIFDMAEEEVLDRMRNAAIREVAAVWLERHKEWHKTDEDGRDVELVVGEWLSDALPSDHGLTWIVGDFVYELLDGSSWEEQFHSIESPIREDLGDIASDLRNRVDGYPDAQEAVSEELVGDFYGLWRTRFYQRVLREVEEFRKVTQTGGEGAARETEQRSRIEPV